MAGLSLFNNFSTLFVKKQPDVTFKFREFPYFAVNNQYKEDSIAIKFDLDVDLTEVFDWNTHLIFAYLSVEFEHDKSSYNQVTFWDDIILRSEPEKHHITLTNDKAEYFITDQYKNLRGKSARIVFNWEHMPIVGFNYKNKQVVGEVTFPEKYSKRL